jgi:parallel beta-helix repeat protein
VTILSPTPTTSTILLRANVNPQGSSTQAWFEFGYYATVNSSHTTPVRSLGSGATNVLLQDKLTNLKPSRIHYYRVMTKSDGVTRAGITCSVKTLGDATPTTPTPAPAPAPAPAPPATADYYVSTTGNDGNSGSATSPWRTLSKAISATPAGKVVGVRAGTYDGFVINRSGSAGAPITLMGVEAGVVVRATSERPNAIEIQGADYIRILNMTITGGRARNNAGVKILDGSRSIEIADSTITANHSFGIDANGSTEVAIRRNTITGNDTGIRINRSGAGTVIEDNQVNDNTGMVVNDTAPGNDSGAVAISFLNTVGPVLARRNVMHGNRGKSYDYNYDGGAFEIYGASGVTMTDNVMWNNQATLETGTSGNACNDNVFARNIAYGGNDKSLVTSPSAALVSGVHLRCGTRMLIANNVFDDLDYWVYDINVSSGFSGSIDGFRILNNVHMQRNSKVYAIMTTLPSNAVIANNVSWSTAGVLADVKGKGQARSVSQAQSMTGQFSGEVFADPLVVNLAGHDYRLQAGSPAIDRGRSIPGITDGFTGAAPDAGRYER